LFLEFFAGTSWQNLIQLTLLTEFGWLRNISKKVILCFTKRYDWFGFQNGTFASICDVLRFNHSISTDRVPRMYSKSARGHHLILNNRFIFSKWFPMFRMLRSRSKILFINLAKLIHIPNSIQTASLIKELWIQPWIMMKFPVFFTVF